MISFLKNAKASNIKLFETIADMNNDTKAKEGDIAIVYKNSLQNITADSEFSSCIFPQTVVLPSEFTDNIYGSFRAVDSSSGNFDGMVVLNQSTFRFDGYGEEEIQVEYTSEDGITYTRIDEGEETIDFGTSIKYELMGEFNEAIGYFMQIGSSNFGGLYEYKNNAYNVAKSQLTATNNYVYEKTFLGSNGVSIGTIAQNTSNSFADVDAEIYTKIQENYNNMTPRVLTDNDKTIDKNIYFIPVKSDGTPFLDTSSVTSMYDMFSECTNLKSVPLLNTSNVTNMFSMFMQCTNLESVSLLNTSNVTSMNYMFSQCASLESVPLLDTSNATDVRNMFNGCASLVTVPQLNMRNIESYKMENMFQSCPSLSNTSLNNILAMCVTATKITASAHKKLKYIGLTQAQATICQSLSNYTAFVNAGWTTGY